MIFGAYPIQGNYRVSYLSFNSKTNSLEKQTVIFKSQYFISQEYLMASTHESILYEVTH